MNGRPSIRIVSERMSTSHQAWWNNYEFEDVCARYLNSQLVAPKSRLIGTRFEPVTRRLRDGRYRQDRSLTAEHADILLLVGMGPSSLKMLNAVPKWRERHGLALAFLVDVYPLAHHLIDKRIVSQLDTLFVSYDQMVAPIASMFDVNVSWLPQAADVLGSMPLPRTRRLDLSAFGRQPTGLIDALSRTMSRPGSERLAYWSGSASPYVQHGSRDRAGFWALMRHSSATLCFRFEDTNLNEYRGVSPMTARWFEAAAAGTAILGSAPTSPGLDSVDFPQTIPLPIDPNRAVQEIEVLLGDNVLLQNARLNHSLACSGHDWRHRLAHLLRHHDVPVPTPLSEDLARLLEMSAQPIR